MREGSDVFAVHSFLPAETSFGLMTEMRQRSSGGASASLLLSHWERLQVPKTTNPKIIWWHLTQVVVPATLASDKKAAALFEGWFSLLASLHCACRCSPALTFVRTHSTVWWPGVF